MIALHGDAVRGFGQKVKNGHYYVSGSGWPADGGEKKTWVLLATSVGFQFNKYCTWLGAPTKDVARGLASQPISPFICPDLSAPVHHSSPPLKEETGRPKQHKPQRMASALSPSASAIDLTSSAGASKRPQLARLQLR